MTIPRRDSFWFAALIAMPPALLACAQQQGQAHMSTKTATEARNKALTEASFRAWRDGTGSPYDLLAGDAQWTIVGKSLASRTYMSKADFIDNVIRPFVTRMQQQLR